MRHLLTICLLCSPALLVAAEPCSMHRSSHLVSTSAPTARSTLVWQPAVSVAMQII